jgi:hypothetical protein
MVARDGKFMIRLSDKFLVLPPFLQFKVEHNRETLLLMMRRHTYAF